MIEYLHPLRKSHSHPFVSTFYSCLITYLIMSFFPALASSFPKNIRPFLSFEN